MTHCPSRGTVTRLTVALAAPPLTGGALAMDKATDPELKAFAAAMMQEHRALRLRGEELQKQLSLSAVTSRGPWRFRRGSRRARRP